MNSLEVWQDFVCELKKGSLPSYRFRPHHDSLLETLPSVLDQLRPNILTHWEREMPQESFVSENQLHYIFNLGPGTTNFCFSFLIENGQWYFQHIETIFIRLDQVRSFPASNFPDLPEETKAWCRDEWHVSEMVKLYRFLSLEKGKEFAMHYFHDGESYLLGVRAWVPFIPPAKAFILYICWEWTNLQNNEVTLLCLDETKAMIRARLRYFDLYQRAGHLQQQISEGDYVELFETIWQDRSNHAGWNLQITYETGYCVFTFTRTSSDGL